MIFRQFIDNETKTLTYVLGDPWSREAVIIDPVRENVARDLSFLEQLGLRLVFSIETHVHADHISGGGLLRRQTGCQYIVSRDAEVPSADRHVTDGDAIQFGLQVLEVRETPGHTAGCVSYVSANRPLVFTGDALLIRGCGRTDFQGGDARTLYRSIRDKLFSLSDETLVYPGHDYQGRTVSSVREERLYNPRLGQGRTEDQFVEIMDGLGLALPRRIAVSVPANQHCGLFDEDEQTNGLDPAETNDFDWPMERTPTGAPNVAPIWVAHELGRFRLIDVRTREEWNGPDGRLPGAGLLPMDEISTGSTGWDRDEPIVLYCRSGGRSDRAATELERAGFRRVASMRGGILRWNNLGFALEGGEQG